MKPISHLQKPVSYPSGQTPDSWKTSLDPFQIDIFPKGRKLEIIIKALCQLDVPQDVTHQNEKNNKKKGEKLFLKPTSKLTTPWLYCGSVLQLCPCTRKHCHISENLVRSRHVGCHQSYIHIHKKPGGKNESMDATVSFG